jgi:hypothetical protein
VDDPISHFKLTTIGYEYIGKMISDIHKPTLFVMEGFVDLAFVSSFIDRRSEDIIWRLSERTCRPFSADSYRLEPGPHYQGQFVKIQYVLT